jgi:hypothetical protein
MTWRELPLGAGGYVTSVRIYPDGTMLARTDTNGFYSWTNGRWNSLFTAASLPTADVTMTSSGGYGIAACAYDTNSSTALVGDTAQLYAVWRDGNARIFTSQNRGEKWTDTGQAVAGANGNDDKQKVNDPYVWCDPASAGQVAYVSVPGAAPLVTTSGGRTWTPVAGLPAPTSMHGSLIAGDPTSAVVSGVTQHVFISVYGSGVWETKNGGQSWALTLSGPTEASCIAVDKFGVLCVNSGLGEYANSRWSSIALHDGAAAFAIDPRSTSEATEHIAVARGSGGLQVTQDGGATWTRYTWTTTYSAADIPWLGAAQQGQIKGIPSIYADVGKIAFDMQGNLFESAGIGVWKAAAPVTAASNFVSQSLGIEQLVVTRVFSPPGSNPCTTVWDRGIFCFAPGAYPTGQYTQKIGIAGGWDADYASSNPSVIAAVVNSNIGQGEAPGVSQDGGKTWTPFASYPSGNVGGMIAAASPTDMILVPGQGAGIYCTKNGGGSWTSIPGLPTGGWLGSYYLRRHVLAADRVIPDTFYVLNDGVYSVSGGCNGAWRRVRLGHIDNFDGWNAELEAVPGEAGHLFYTGGPQGCGKHPCPESFWRSVDGGATWQSMPAAKEVIAFGFGAPKVTGGYPTIFIAGWVGRVYGIWRSDDRGDTWSNIGTWPNGNIDQVVAVSGDMNNYGVAYVGFAGSGAAAYR